MTSLFVFKINVDYNGTGSTFEGYGYTNFTLKYDLNETEMLEVNYTFKSGIQNSI